MAAAMDHELRELVRQKSEAEDYAAAVAAAAREEAQEDVREQEHAYTVRQRWQRGGLR